MVKQTSERATFDQELDAVKAVLKALDGLSSESKQWALKTASDRLGMQPPAGAGSPPVRAGTAQPPAAAAPTTIGRTKAKEFLAAKRPTTDVERVACLAYYLTHAKNKPHFK